MGLEKLLKEACKYWRVEPSYILQKSRKREIVQKRQILQYIACEQGLGTLEEIGAFFGGKDHATVLNSKKTIKGLLYLKQISVDVMIITSRLNTPTEKTYKILIIDKSFSSFPAIFIGENNNKINIEVRNNDFSERNDKKIRTFERDCISGTIEGRIKIIKINVFL